MQAAKMDGYVTMFRSAGSKTKETCKQCRFRKVRCDGRPGTCGNCERLSFDCSFSHSASPGGPDEEGPAASSQSRPERRRASKACDGCREQKVRCSGDVPQCLNCKRRRVRCSYPSATRRRTKPRMSNDNDPLAAESPAASSPAQLATPISAHPSPDDTVDALPADSPANSERSELVIAPDYSLSSPTSPGLVDYFFDVVYALPSYAFLYRPKTRQRWINGTIDEALRLAISGVALSYQESSRRAGAGEPSLAAVEHPLASQWIQRAEHIVWERLEFPTVSRLQALMLVILYRINIGQFQRAFMLLSLAARAAAAMRLNHERSDQHSTTLEVRRRLMWCMKLVERYFCIGLPEFELCPLENIYLRLPSCERDFAEGSAGVDKDGPGAYPLCIRLERLRRDIMRMTRSLALCEEPFPSLPQLVRDFETELNAIGEQMEDGPILGPDKLARILHVQWLPRHILMHLSWYECHCDMYRLFVRGYREAAPDVVLDALDPGYLTQAETLCFQHATRIIQTLSSLNQQSVQPRLLEFDTAVCAYQATRLLLFLSRTGRSGTVHATEEFALSRAELCLAALKRFFPGSILVKPMIEEMSRAISAFPSPGSNEPEKLLPPLPRRHRDKSPQQQLSAAAKARQRLAIHSLLRQADFSDGDEDDEPQPGPYPRPLETINPGLGSAPVVNSPRPDFPQRGQPPSIMPIQQTPPDSTAVSAAVSEGDGSQKSPYSPCVTFEWQDRDLLSKGFDFH